MGMGGSGRRLLMIDDDPEFLDLTSRMLMRSGFRVLVANSWIDALPHLSGPLDLVLLDLHMVSLQGDRMCEVLKRNYPGLRVVLFSSADPDELRRAAESSGADGHLQKSMTRDQLAEAILQAMARPCRTSASQRPSTVRCG